MTQFYQLLFVVFWRQTCTYAFLVDGRLRDQYIPDQAMHTDALATQPAEIRLIIDRLCRPFAEDLQWDWIKSPRQITLV